MENTKMHTKNSVSKIQIEEYKWRDVQETKYLSRTSELVCINETVHINLLGPHRTDSRLILFGYIADLQLVA